MKVKSESEVAQSCLTLSDPMDCSLPKSLQTLNAGEGVEKREPSYPVGGNAN